MQQLRLLFILALSLSSPGVFAAAPVTFVEHIDEFPNICQSCYPNDLVDAGEKSCAQAVFSNWIIWLSKHGYESIVEKSNETSTASQLKVVQALTELSGKKPDSGTTPELAFQGLRKFFETKHIYIRRIAAVGWREIPNFISKESEQVSLEWIKESVFLTKYVLLHIGWFVLDAKKSEYVFSDGHWVAVVGYGKDSAGKDSPNELIVLDPAGRASRNPIYVKAEILSQGVLSLNKGVANRFPRDAKGALSLGANLVMKRGANLAVVFGAYRIEL